MKKMNNMFFKTLSAALISCAVASTSFASSWTSVYNQNFSGEVNPPSSNAASMKATVENEALRMKSDSMCYLEMTSTDENKINSAGSHGIKLFNATNLIKPVSPSVVENGVAYDYQGAGDTASFPTVKTDKNGVTHYALKHFTYSNIYGGTRTNSLVLEVGAGLFSNNEENVIIEFTYLATQTGDENKYTFQYTPGTSGFYANTTFSPEVENEWAIGRVEIPAIDFVNKPSFVGNGHFKISMHEGTENYIHSVNIYRAEQGEKEEGYNSIKKQIGDSLVYDEAQINYDLFMPENIYAGSESFNSGEGGFSTACYDKNDNEIARLDYLLTEDGMEINLAYGEDETVQIYSGERLNERTLHHTVTIDTNEDAYKVKIEDNDGAVIVDETEFYGIMSFDPMVEIVEVRHDKASRAIITDFDNLEIKTRVNPDHSACYEDLNSISIQTEAVTDFELPTMGEKGCIIEWSSSDSDAIKISDDYSKAFVTRSHEEKTVVLTATVVSPLGLYSETKEFEVTVASLEGTFADISDMKERVILTDAGDGTMNAELSMENSGPVAGKTLTFMAVCKDTVTGEKGQVYKISKTPEISYEPLSFELTGLIKPSANQKYDFYLWDENNVSLINNPPSEIVGFKASDNLARHVKLTWDACYDDNAQLYYAIYRDGVLIGQTDTNVYCDASVNFLEKHSYKVIAFDSNDLQAKPSIEAEGNIIEMYYLDLTDPDLTVHVDEGNYQYGWSAPETGGDILVVQQNPDQGSYSQYKTVVDADGNKSGARLLSKGKYLSFVATVGNRFQATGKITSADRNIVIRLTYLDTTGNILLRYNSVLKDSEPADYPWQARVYEVVNQMGGTNKWKTAEIKLTDANFSQANSFTDFEFSTSSSEGLYVKKVEVIQTENYE